MHLPMMICFLALTLVSAGARTCQAGADTSTCPAERGEAAASGQQALLQVGSTRGDAASTLLEDTVPEAPANILLVSETEEHEDEEEASEACGTGSDCPKGQVPKEKGQSKVDAAIATVETLNPGSKEALEAEDVAREEKNGEAVNVTEVVDVVNKASSEETLETARHNGNDINSDEIEKLTGGREYGKDAKEGDEAVPRDEKDRLLLEQLTRGLGWKPWAEGKVKYCYAADVSVRMESLIEVALDAIKRAVPCIQFENLGITSVKSTEKDSKKKTCGSDPGPAIFFQTANKGCWSYVGEISPWKAQMLNLADPGCGVLGIAIHEILHALGQGHEHVRGDRDSMITIAWNNIKDKYRPFFLKKSKAYDQDAYDYNSVMHYGTGSFSQNGKPVIIVPKGAAAVGQRTALSQADANQLADMYKKVNDSCAATNQNEKVGCKDIGNYKCPTDSCSAADVDKCCACGGGIEYKCWDGSACEYPKKLKFKSDSVCIVDGSSIWKGAYGCVIRNSCSKKLKIKCTGEKGKTNLPKKMGWAVSPYPTLCNKIDACKITR